MRLILLLLAGTAVCCPAQTAKLPSDRLLAPFGMEHFSGMYRRSLDVFFTAQMAYQHGDDNAAWEVLDAFWKLYPPGSQPWVRGLREADAVSAATGADFGTPECYAALRMLTECVAWRRQNRTPRLSVPVRWTVVLVGHSHGLQPADFEELRAHTGRPVVHTLNPAITADDNAVVRQQLWLLLQYITAITSGKLTVDLRIVRYLDLDIPMRVVENPYTQPHLSAEPAPGALDQVWEAVGPEERARTDSWVVIYPSHRPEDLPAFSQTDFSNGGGTTTGPDGDSFATFGDDLALIRKSRRERGAPYSPEERLVYFGQVMQHEFFHHLFRSYPEFKLEAKSHQWFDRKSWPSDFDGSLEQDYYAESLHKRLMTADPPLYSRLRYAVPAAVLAALEPKLLRGAYRRESAQNAPEQGRIEQDASGGLRWKNQAGKSWGLSLDRARCVLHTDDSNPYRRFGLEGSRDFRIVWKRGEAGEFLPEVAGFRFLGDFYKKQ